MREIDEREREKSKNKKLLLYYDYIIALYINNFLLSVEKWMREKQDEKM